METNSNGNGNGHKPSLEMLGAPHWYCVSHRSLEARIEKLEAAVLTGSSAKGRKWGAIAGTFCAVFVSTALSQCNPLSEIPQKSKVEIHP